MTCGIKIKIEILPILVSVDAPCSTLFPDSFEFPFDVPLLSYLLSKFDSYQN